MKKWIAKAIVQKTISFLLWSNRINFLFQKYVTRGVQLSDEYFFDRLQHASDHLKSWYSTNKNSPAVSLELGTGWYPVVPLSLFLSGTEKIFTIDISKLTNRERLMTTLQKFHSVGETELKKYIPLNQQRYVILESVLKNLPSTFEKICEQFNLTCLVKDAAKTDFEDGSVDLITSNNTFEHVYPTALKNILKEFFIKTLLEIVNKEYHCLHPIQ